MGPMQTPEGLMAAVGVSPRPTEAPNANGVPKELRPRQKYQFPPPDSWCGFVSSQYSELDREGRLSKDSMTDSLNR